MFADSEGADPVADSTVKQLLREGRARSKGRASEESDADSAWLADCGTGAPCDAAVAGQGADPSALTEVDALRYDAGPPKKLRPITGANAMTFYSNRSEGIHVDGLDNGESFPLPLQGFRADNSPAVARKAWSGDSTLGEELAVLIRLVGWHSRRLSNPRPSLSL